MQNSEYNSTKKGQDLSKQTNKIERFFTPSQKRKATSKLESEPPKKQSSKMSDSDSSTPESTPKWAKKLATKEDIQKSEQNIKNELGFRMDKLESRMSNMEKDTKPEVLQEKILPELEKRLKKTYQLNENLRWDEKLSMEIKADKGKLSIRGCPEPLNNKGGFVENLSQLSQND